MSEKIKISNAIRDLNKDKKFESVEFREKEKKVSRKQTQEELKHFEAKIVVPEKKLDLSLRKNLKSCRILIDSLRSFSPQNHLEKESEKDIYFAIWETCGGDLVDQESLQLRMGWLMNELGFDLNYFDPDSRDVFDMEDLKITEQRRAEYEFARENRDVYSQLPLFQQIAVDSLQLLGNDYKWGGIPRVKKDSSPSSFVFENIRWDTFRYEGPSDCSGVPFALYKTRGIELPRTSAAQYTVCEILHDPSRKTNKIINYAAGRPADLIFSRTNGITHVVVILENLGDGKYSILHAPHTGAEICIETLDLTLPENRNRSIGRPKKLIELEAQKFTENQILPKK